MCFLHADLNLSTLPRLTVWVSSSSYTIPSFITLFFTLAVLFLSQNQPLTFVQELPCPVTESAGVFHCVRLLHSVHNRIVQYSVLQYLQCSAITIGFIYLCEISSSQHSVCCVQAAPLLCPASQPYCPPLPCVCDLYLVYTSPLWFWGEPTMCWSQVAMPWHGMSSCAISVLCVTFSVCGKTETSQVVALGIFPESIVVLGYLLFVRVGSLSLSLSLPPPSPSSLSLLPHTKHT